jgi:hypothetical protein
VKITSTRVVLIGLFIMLLAGRSSVAAQQSQSVNIPDEPLSEQVNDPTANLTQFKVQNIYTPSRLLIKA